MVKVKLDNDEECAGTYFDLPNLELRDDQDFYFDVENKNLVIIFPKYEIAPGMCNVLECEISFREITDYVNPSGPLSFLYNPALDEHDSYKKNSIDFSLMQVEKFSKEIEQEFNNS